MIYDIAERLEKALLVNVPAIFYAAWKLISPWIDPHTRDKVFFISTAQAASKQDKVLTCSCMQSSDRAVPNVESRHALTDPPTT